jgi:hypothetical protein
VIGRARLGLLSASITVSLFIAALKSLSVLILVEPLVTVSPFVAVIGVLIIVILIRAKRFAFFPVTLANCCAITITNIESRVLIGSLAVDVVVWTTIIPPPIIAIRIGIATLCGVAIQLSSLMAGLRAVIAISVDRTGKVTLILLHATRAVISILGSDGPHDSKESHAHD